MSSSVQHPNSVLFLVDVSDADYLDLDRRSEYWKIVTHVLDFKYLHSSIDEIGRIAAEHKVDFLLYSQNDQVGKRISIGPIHKRLQLGYSSISAIDRGSAANRVSQMQICYDDFLVPGRMMPAAPSKEAAERATTESTGTFSLAFDTEQLGGVRFGLPRILNVLSKYRVKATFFVTDLVHRVYGNLLGTLSHGGHELAPHGLCHEDLTLLNRDEQVVHVRAMIDRLGLQPIGSNFIGRMNEDTIAVLMKLGVRYFVYFDTNFYRLISYPKRPTRPSLVRGSGGAIWAFPISVQTYGVPWFSIKNMLDTAVLQSQHCGFPHVSVLGHPFRDGSSNNIRTTEKLIVRLLEKGLQPITLADLATRIEPEGAQTLDRSESERFLSPTRSPVSFPSNMMDYAGFLPQTAISFARRCWPHSLF